MLGNHFHKCNISIKSVNLTDLPNQHLCCSKAINKLTHTQLGPFAKLSHNVTVVVTQSLTPADHMVCDTRWQRLNVIAAVPNL